MLIIILMYSTCQQINHNKNVKCILPHSLMLKNALELLLGRMLSEKKIHEKEIFFPFIFFLLKEFFISFSSTFSNFKKYESCFNLVMISFLFKTQMKKKELLVLQKKNQARFYADIGNVIEPADIIYYCNITIVFISKCLFTRF